MRRIETLTCCAALGLLLASAVAVQAQLTPAQKCEKLKNKHAAKRALCTAVQRGKEIAGRPFNYAGCTTAMADKFTTFEQNAINQGGACPTTGDAAEIEARIDGIFNPSNAIPKALSAVRFVDNGDGTVTDTQTGLQWEQKDSLDGVANLLNKHDADNTYSWNTTALSAPPNGTAFTDFLGALNNCPFDGAVYGVSFAGRCDWRLPTEAELLSIVDVTVAGCGSGSPCIPAVFGQTQAGFYWSSTSDAGLPFEAWGVHFLDGTPDSGSKGTSLYVRAVRGGS